MQLVMDKKVDIFGVMETKTLRDDIVEVVKGFKDWSIISKENSELEPLENRDSI